MFRRFFRPIALIGSLGYLSSHPIFSQSDEENAVNLMKRVMYMPSFRETQTINIPKPTLVYIYDSKYLEKSQLATKIEKNLKRADEYGYSLAKRFISNEEDRKEFCKESGISEEEYTVRMEHEGNLFFINNGRNYKIPIGTKRQEIDSWVAKCQEPIIKVKSISEFYKHARSVIFDENSHIIVGYKLTDEERKVLEKMSQYKIKISFVEASDDLAEKYGLEPGISLCRPHSRFDGEFDTETHRALKFIPMNKKDPSFDDLDLWIQNNNTTKVYYCDQFEKIFPLFQKTYRGPLKCMYVLTSGLNPDSKKYIQLVKDLAELADQYKDLFIIAIIPKDELAKKLGCLRNGRLRRMKEPEIRFTDFKKMISTKENPEGGFQVVDCTNPDAKCADLTDTHYTGKYNFQGHDFSKEKLKEFIENSLQGKNEQYYEEESVPLAAVRKLSAVNFNKEVIDSDKDVIIELYGKYCPSCIAFKEEFNQLAKELKPHSDKLLVAKVCIDHNFIPEISDKKKYTPIFWYYKKGDKANPIQHKGKRDVKEIKEFIKQNASFNLEE
ncbi:unnamed protein product [Blepharisma stoltei]|uniref:Thioredoxin domain-containing protein n=1 Tax=Blepharisma stoltei TaxID=1481888 RepID=A0AAU9KMC5_9CILI|nr:unnamed protein product [Blepharisma stoltei]